MKTKWNEGAASSVGVCRCLTSTTKFVPSEALKNTAPVNLLELESRNDYTARIAEKKSIFKRVVLILIASLLGVAGTSCVKPELVKPLERPSLVVPSDDEIAREIIKQLEIKGKKDFDRSIQHVMMTSYLASIGKPAVPALIDALSNSDYRIRECAAEALGKIADERAIPALINALKDKSGLVDYDAARALERIGKPSIPFLVKALKDKDDNIRYAAARVLDRFNGFLGKFKWVPQNDEEEASYLFAKRDFKTLATINKPTAIPYLLESLKNEDCVIREISAKGLNSLNWKPQTDEEKLLYLFAMTDLEALVKIGSPATPILIRALRDEEPEIHRFAAIALGRIGDKQAVPALIEALKYEINFNARACIVLALGEIGDKRATPVLRGLLSKGEVRAFMRGDVDYNHLDNIRSYYARALGKMKDTESIPLLIEALWTGNLSVHRSASAALLNIGEPSIPALMENFRNENFGPDQIVIRILIDIGKPAIPALIEALKDRSSSVRTCAAIVALGDIGDEQAIPALREISADKSDKNYSMSHFFAEEAIRKIKERKNRNTSKRTEK